MKKLATLFIALWSLTAWANIDLFSAASAGEGTLHFSGDGVYYDVMKDVRGRYMAAMSIKSISSNNDKRRAHFDWHIVVDDGSVETYSLILEGDHELLTVYVPASADSHEDFSSYVKAGYGYVASANNAVDADKGKELVFLNYLYHDGNRYDEHLMVEHDAEGSIVITSNGTIGNDKDGMLEIWTDSYRQL